MESGDVCTEALGVPEALMTPLLYPIPEVSRRPDFRDQILHHHPSHTLTGALGML